MLHIYHLSKESLMAGKHNSLFIELDHVAASINDAQTEELKKVTGLVDDLFNLLERVDRI